MGRTPHPSKVPSGGTRSPWLEAWWVTPRWVDEVFERQRAIDPFGHRVQTWLGALACLCLGGPTSVAELGAVPLLIAFTIRVHRHWRTWGQFFFQPLFLVALGWMSLGLASRMWTHGDAWAWREELGVSRFVVLAIALWTVSDRRVALLGALAAGMLVGQLSQLSHAVGLALGIDWMTWPRLPGRNSGWWDPVVGGSLLVAALGLHLPAAVFGRDGWRLAGFAGTAITIAGIVATGTRGAWLAAAGLVVVVLAAGAWRVRPRRLLVRPALALVAACALGAAVVWATMGEQVRSRAVAGYAEVVGAVEGREFRSDSGARVLMAWWALEAIGARPLRGVGLGGYEPWTREHVEAQGIDPATRRFHAHAHNAILHAGATLGVPGLALAIAFAALAIRGAARRLPGDGPPGYADGPCFALVGLLLVSAFDSIQVNSHTAAMLAVLMVFAVQQRPKPAR